MSQERRKCTRIAFKNSCFLSGNDRRVPAELLDISMKGALVAPEDVSFFSAGGSCDLEVSLGDASSTMKMQAEMVHCDNVHIGIHFIHTDLESLTHLRKLIELNTGDPERAAKELMLWSTSAES